ncbi:g10679 [Coccomyxa elongata]
MGKEGKSKKSHKRRRDVEEDTDDDDSGSSEDDSARDKSKHKKSKKGKKEKKHKKSSEDKDLLKAAKKFLKKKLRGGDAGDTAGPQEDNEPLEKGTVIETLTEDDYFRKNAEFSEWLRVERGQFFNEMTTEETHALFSDFVIAWNGRKLPARYYRGIADASLRRTKHAWAIRGKEGTERSALGMAAAMEDDREAFGAQKQAQAAERKTWRREQREALDEMLPKATGREAQIEKKMARREAAKERDASPDIVKLPGGGDVMGGDDSLEAARAREAKRSEWRTKQQMVKREEVSHKLSVAQATEDEKMAAFRAIVAQGPISIPKRQ